MATTTIDPGNIYVAWLDWTPSTPPISGNTITHDANKVVKISTTKIDTNLDNPIILIPIPVSKGGRGANTTYARALDLKRIKEAVSVQGFLADEASESAITKRNNLTALGKDNDALTVVWGQGNYQTLWRPNKDSPTTNTGVFILKVMFTETAGIVGEAVSGDAQPDRNISIQITLVRGKDM